VRAERVGVCVCVRKYTHTPPHFQPPRTLSQLTQTNLAHNAHSDSANPKKNKKLKIFNDGYLGSHIDEERSEMRYAMRIAESASHQIFERNWRWLAASMFGSVCKDIAHRSVVEAYAHAP
jgi:hypothetical protein